MTLRKKSIDNVVKYIPRSDPIQKIGSKPKTIKNISFPKKQDRKIHETIKTSFKLLGQKDL